MAKKINALVLVGIIGTFVFGSHLVTSLGRAYWGEQNIWWTNRDMKLSLEESREKVEVFFKNELVQDKLASGKVKITYDSVGTEPLRAGDFTVRINNLDKMRAKFLGFALISAFFLGLCLACLVLGLIGFRKKAGT